MVYWLINHAGIRKSRAAASRLRILLVFYKHLKWFMSLLNHRNLGSMNFT